MNTSIHDHAGMRPRRYGETGYRLTREDETHAIGALKTMLSTGSDPLDVGRLVLRAIQRNEPYVLTDARSKAFVESPLDALLASLPNDEPDFRRLEVDMELRRMLSESLALTAAAARDATRSGVR